MSSCNFNVPPVVGKSVGGGGAGNVSTVDVLAVDNIMIGAGGTNIKDSGVDISAISGQKTVRQVNSNTNITITDDIIEISGAIPISSPSITLTLDATTQVTGKTIEIKANGLINSSLTIVLQSLTTPMLPFILTRRFQYVKIFFNGTTWVFLTDQAPLQAETLNFSIPSTNSGQMPLYGFNSIQPGASVILSWDADLFQPFIAHAGSNDLLMWYSNDMNRAGKPKFAVPTVVDTGGGYTTVDNDTHYFTDDGNADPSFDYTPKPLAGQYPMTTGIVRLGAFGANEIAENVRIKMEIESRGNDATFGGVEIELTVRSSDLLGTT